MISNFLKSLILSYMFLNTYSDTLVNKKDNYNDITYWIIEPKSYICMCTPNSVLVKNPTLNANVWDTYCSNLQQCIWNEHEIIIKTWYEQN